MPQISWCAPSSASDGVQTGEMMARCEEDRTGLVPEDVLYVICVIFILCYIYPWLLCIEHLCDFRRPRLNIFEA